MKWLLCSGVKSTHYRLHWTHADTKSQLCKMQFWLCILVEWIRLTVVAHCSSSDSQHWQKFTKINKIPSICIYIRCRVNKKQHRLFLQNNGNIAGDHWIGALVVNKTGMKWTTCNHTYVRAYNNKRMFLWVCFLFWFTIDIKNGRCVHFYMCAMRNKMKSNAIFVGLDFFRRPPRCCFHRRRVGKETHCAMSVFYGLTINLPLVV